MPRALFAVLLSSLLCACVGGKTAVKAEAPAPAPQNTPLPELPNQVESRAGRILGKDAEGCTWVLGEATVAVGPQDTRHQVRAAATEQARAGAIQDALGVEVKSKFMDFQQEGLRGQSRLTEGILQTTRSGRILKEQILEENFRDAPDCPACLYRLKLKACVLPHALGGDRDFHVELAVSSVRFKHGEPASFEITPNRDCSVYVYNVYDLGALGVTALVVPNSAMQEKRLKAGEIWVYPGEEDKKRGVSLTAELPKPSDTVSAETIRVIATKTPLPKAVYDPTVGGWLGVLRRLNQSHAEWAEDAEAYTIYQR